MAGYVGLRRDDAELAVVTTDSLEQLLGLRVGQHPRFEMFVYVEDVDAQLQALSATMSECRDRRQICLGAGGLRGRSRRKPDRARVAWAVAWAMVNDPLPARYLAQVNVSRARAGLEDAVMSGFLAAADPLDRLAEQAPGFVWRLRSAHASGVTVTGATDKPLIVNVSLWRSYEDLHAYVYRSAHGQLLIRRDRWMLPVPPPSTALWWLPSEQRPDLDQALLRLEYLRRYGPSPQAFGLRRRFHFDGTPASTWHGR